MADRKKVAIMAAGIYALGLAPPLPPYHPTKATPKKPTDRARVKAARKQRRRHD